MKKADIWVVGDISSIEAPAFPLMASSSVGPNIVAFKDGADAGMKLSKEPKVQFIRIFELQQLIMAVDVTTFLLIWWIYTYVFDNVDKTVVQKVSHYA